MTTDRADPIEDRALARRSDKVREQLRDAERVYDPVAEESWGTKYKFFSELKMKGTYRTYARARHDPFNKDPAWGKTVLKNVANFCEAKGIQAEDVFKSVDVDGDAQLAIPEVKKALCKVLPNLSDQELIAVFDAIDTDKSGQVSLNEFVAAMEVGRKAKVSKAATERHRNPIHRIHRVPPAIMEGWAHLADPEAVQGTRYERIGCSKTMGEACDKETNDLMERLSDALMSTPRALQNPNNVGKYHWFGGGADMNRFRRSEHQRSRAQTAAWGSSAKQAAPVPDPGGPDVRPGFLCDPTSARARGLPSYTPPRSSRGAEAAAM